QPIREIVGQAALKFDPSDVDAIRKAMERIVFDKELRAQLSAEGPARAAKFSWETSARETLAALERAVAQRSRSSS
ncbi:MAG: hypothetical protein LLG20_24065, partial [Acidobacteriales bacterium]|nr:hypothetical protein [Terriglobales bacterium]